MSRKKESLFTPWFEDEESAVAGVRVLNEKKDGRAVIFDQLVNAATDHLVGLKVIEKLGGFPKAKRILKGRIPEGKIQRSGFLGEVLATEFVLQETEYDVPVRRLRYRGTRDLAMRGDDVLGFRVAKKRAKVLKVEAKSRAKLTTDAVTEAREGLAKRKGRPNPESLAMLECILRLADRDDEAEPIATLQNQSIKADDICHLLLLTAVEKCGAWRRESAALGVKKHEGFDCNGVEVRPTSFWLFVTCQSVVLHP